MKKQFKLTADGVAELEKEMKELIAQRGDISERIKTAREFGDLSENAEYSSARQEQERTESKINEIDTILKNVEIIKNPVKNDKVVLGNVVKLKGSSGDREFTIVGSVQADPMNGKISDESPIGQALLGKKIGDDVDIVTPTATTKYVISGIS